METLAFLQTKLQRPRVDDDLVSRPRLLEQTNRGLERPLTLVSAPAGFGKTTLLSAWLQGQDIHSSWISLDENDDDLGIFLRYFAASIERVFPNACENILPLLNAPLLPPKEYLAAELVNELAALPEEFVLVLDDYHFIQAETIHQMLTTLICNMPSQVHLMIATRKDPPFPLSLLRGRKQVLEIRAVDLRFTPEEAKAYLEGVLGEEVELIAVSSLTSSAEGWITGLRLAALSMQGQADLKISVDTLAGSSTYYVREYLFNEVFSRQPQDIQDFLLQTSILNRFCSELCDAVIGTSTSHALLEKIRHPNLFLVYLDAERKWNRYHHLFRDMLRQRMKRTFGQEKINELHRRASAWHGKEGMIEQALNHALAAGDTAGAVQLIENSRHELLNSEDWSTLERWLNKLSDEVVSERPELLLARAWTFELRYQAAMISPILQEVETLLSAEDTVWTDAMVQDSRGEISALKSCIYFMKDENALALESSLSGDGLPKHRTI